jgi:DNA-binding FrmR family transcriptional regulator
MTMGPARGTRAAGATRPGDGVPPAQTAGAQTAGAQTAEAQTAEAADDHDHSFRHSYTRDRAQLLRRLSRLEGQVRGIARMIEREEYCVDILQQTAALRAAIDAVSIMVLEDHVQGCIRTAAERGEADQYVDEVLDVVRRTLGRPVRSSSRP